MSEQSREPSVSGTPIHLLAQLREDPADPVAWKQLVDRFGPRIYAWCRRWGLQEADARDATQNVLVAIFERMGRFRYDPTKSFRSYLKTLAHYACCDLKTARAVTPGTEDGRSWREALSTEEAGYDLARSLEEAHEQEVLSAALDRVATRVDERTLEAFRLMAFEGLKGFEAAERLGMKVSSVFVAKCRVQKMLQDEVRILDPP